MYDYRKTRLLVWLMRISILLPAQACAADEIDADSDLVITQSVAAHGGTQLSAMTTIVTEWLLDDSQIFESRKPGPPWDKAQKWEAYAIAFDSGQYADARFDSGSGYEWITSTIITDSRAYRLDHRNRSYRQTRLGFDDAIADAMALSPLILLRWLTDHRELAEYAGRRQEDTVDLHVLRVHREDGRDLEVSIESETGRIHGLASGYTDYDGTYVPLHYRYFDWRRSDGFYYPARIEVRARGYTLRQAALAHIAFGKSIAEHLVVPAVFTEAPGEPQGVREFRVEEITDGVFFVGQGVMYQLFVEFDDFLVALDGSSGDVMRRVRAVQERIPDKPFRYVLASHHHNDHLHGLDEFAALGATIIASPTHIATVSEYVEEKLGTKPKILALTETYDIQQGSRELQIIDIGPTPHSEHILAAYLPDERILFAADLFVLGGRRTPVKPAMANALALAESIRTQGLAVRLIVDPHSPLIATAADLQQSVDLVHAADEDIKSSTRRNLAAWRSADRYVRQ